MISQSWPDVVQRAKDMLQVACDKAIERGMYGTVSVVINVNGPKGPSRPIAEVRETFIQKQEG